MVLILDNFGLNFFIFYLSEAVNVYLMENTEFRYLRQAQFNFTFVSYIQKPHALINAPVPFRTEP
jgi:hypothetical protein